MSADSNFGAGPAPGNKSLWDSGIVYLCRSGPDGSIRKLTPAFRRMIAGHSAKRVPDILSELLHPEDKQTFLDDLARVCTNGSSIERRPVRIVPPDGRVLLMEVCGEREGDEALLWWWERSSEEAFISGVEAQHLEEIMDVIKNFTSNLFDPFILLNMEGRIIHANEPLNHILGYRRTELIGLPVAAVFERQSEKMQKAMMRFAKWMRPGHMRDVSWNLTNRFGEKIPATLSGSVIRSESGELMGMVMVIRDERKNALLADLEKKNRELALAYEELQHIDRMKDDILSLVGHELRAPLANILGYAEFLTEDDLESGDRKKFSRIIYQESQRLTRLVNDILDLTRMEAGRMSYFYVKDSINRVVQAAADSLSADSEIKEVKLVLELDEQIEPLEFDPDRIQQVATNVIHNAIKFTPKGKSVTIRTEQTENGVRVSVKDQGIGIEEQDGHRVFKKFEQIGDVNHHAIGAGLGMPIAKIIIEEGHGGSIGFLSEGRDKGTEFRFLIPERGPAHE